MSTSNAGDIDSLLTSNDNDTTYEDNIHQTTKLMGQHTDIEEPYEKHRAHDLRAECYRRHLRPIKKGPHANDNKGGYIFMLRKDDSDRLGHSNVVTGLHVPLLPQSSALLQMRDIESESIHCISPNTSQTIPFGHKQIPKTTNESKKRKLPIDKNGFSNSMAQARSRKTMPQHNKYNTTAYFQAHQAHQAHHLHNTVQRNMLSVFPISYHSLTNNTSAGITSDLEILSGIANAYTTTGSVQPIQVRNTSTDTTAHSSEGTAKSTSGENESENLDSPNEFCKSCRSILVDQLHESIRFGKRQLELQQKEKLFEIRDRETRHLSDIITQLQQLRATQRTLHGQNNSRYITLNPEPPLNHNQESLEAEINSDIALLFEIKERAKYRIRCSFDDENEFFKDKKRDLTPNNLVGSASSNGTRVGSNQEQDQA